MVGVPRIAQALWHVRQRTGTVLTLADVPFLAAGIFVVFRSTSFDAGALGLWLTGVALVHLCVAASLVRYPPLRVSPRRDEP